MSPHRVYRVLNLYSCTGSSIDQIRHDDQIVSLADKIKLKFDFVKS